MESGDQVLVEAVRQRERFLAEVLRVVPSLVADRRLEFFCGSLLGLPEFRFFAELSVGAQNRPVIGV